MHVLAAMRGAPLVSRRSACRGTTPAALQPWLQRCWGRRRGTDVVHACGLVSTSLQHVGAPSTTLACSSRRASSAHKLAAC
jgi:hypothetical protein